jgi:Gas vesicle protein
MTDAIQPRGGRLSGPRPEGLADLLERVLDRGVIIAGDIVVNLLDIELLTLKLRLLIVSADTAQQMGIDWWRHDAFLTSNGRALQDENRELRSRVEALERALAERAELPQGAQPSPQPTETTEQPERRAR